MFRCFSFDLIRRAGRGIQCLFLVMCCMLCGGAVMIIFGIIALAAPNTRDANIREYTNAINAYKHVAPQTWTGSINGYGTFASFSEVPVRGNLEGVPRALYYFKYATIPFVSSLNTLTYNLDHVVPFSAAVTLQTEQRRSISCTQSYCTSNCGGDSYLCSASSMASACRARYGSNATSESSCSSSSSCACRVTVYASSYCALLSTTSVPAVASSKGCYYPFGASDSYVYTTSLPTHFTAIVRAADDPLIALERITMGRNDFGIPRAHHNRAGIGLLVGGLALTLIVIVMFFIVRYVLQSKQQQFDTPVWPPHQGNPVAYPEPVPGCGKLVEIQPQPSYGDPQPYGEPPAEDGQPQIFYGEPLSVDGQPQQPPSNCQFALVYAQPPPKY